MGGFISLRVAVSPAHEQALLLHKAQVLIDAGPLQSSRVGLTYWDCTGLFLASQPQASKISVAVELLASQGPNSASQAPSNSLEIPSPTATTSSPKPHLSIAPTGDISSA